MLESYRYTAYGEMQIFDELGREMTKSAVKNPWTFASKRKDKETGFVYFSHRYYDPALGSWVTPDPAGFSDGPNLYAYVRNNPLSLVDPFGLSSSWVNDVCSFISSVFSSIFSGSSSRNDSDRDSGYDYSDRSERSSRYEESSRSVNETSSRHHKQSERQDLEDKVKTVKDQQTQFREEMLLVSGCNAMDDDPLRRGRRMIDEGEAGLKILRWTAIGPLAEAVKAAGTMMLEGFSASNLQTIVDCAARMSTGKVAQIYNCAKQAVRGYNMGLTLVGNDGGSSSRSPESAEKSPAKSETSRGTIAGKANPRVDPKNLSEKLALQEAKATPSHPSNEIMQGKINDPHYPADKWSKGQHIHESLDGKTKINIHYWEERATGERHGFKFKND